MRFLPLSLGNWKQGENVKLSLSTCATERRIIPGGFEFAPIEGLQQCKDAGFQYVDFNFANAASDGRPMSCDDWENWIETVCEAKDTLGLTVEQTHGHWFHLNQLASDEELAWHDEMVRRSLVCSSKLGEKPWVVMHPRSIFGTEGYDAKKSDSYNYEKFMELGELAAKLGIRIAVENLFANSCIGACCNAEALVSFVESLRSDVFGICWDFGHANRAGLNHLESLDIVAPYLRVTHCHDNKGRSDDHFIPRFGNVPWNEIMPKLKQIGYTGNLNMEVHVFYNTFPQSLRMDGLRFMRSVGEELVSRFDKA